MPDSVFGILPFFDNIRMIPETIAKYFLPVIFLLIPQFNSFNTTVGIVVIALLLILIARSERGFNPRILFGFFWFFLFLAPVMSYRNPEAPYLFDYLYHRSYLTNIGLVIIILELVIRMRKVRRVPHLLAIVTGCILLYLGFTSFNEVQYYSDPITFYDEAINRSLASALCYNNMGAPLSSIKHDYTAAITNYNKAIKIFPTYAFAYSNRGNSYAKLG